MFARLFNLLGRKSRRSHRATAARQRRPARSRLMCEALEDRQMLSVFGEFHVNTTTRNDQHYSATASAANGRSVVVWTDAYSSTDRDIRAQVYDEAGNRSGGEIIVSYATQNEYSPKVAMDAAGNFVVVWTFDYSSSDKDVKAARFSANGTRLGDITVAGGGYNEYEPSVAMAANGSFAVSYTFDTAPLNADVLVQRYSAGGAYLGQVNVATSSNYEHDSSIAMAPDGRFAVAYQKEYPGNDADARLARYTAGGAYLSDQAMDYSARRDTHPKVAMDNYGNAVVAYQTDGGNNGDILARRVFNDGSMGPELTIAGTADWELQPSVALDPTSGRFVVAYWSYHIPYSYVTVSWVREVSASDSVGSAIILGSDLSHPAVSIGGDHWYLVSYTWSGSPVLPGLEIFARYGYMSPLGLSAFVTLPFAVIAGLDYSLADLTAFALLADTLEEAPPAGNMETTEPESGDPLAEEGLGDGLTGEELPPENIDMVYTDYGNNFIPEEPGQEPPAENTDAAYPESDASSGWEESAENMDAAYLEYSNS